MYAYIDSFRKFGKTNTDNQSIKIKRPYPFQRKGTEGRDCRCPRSGYARLARRLAPNNGNEPTKTNVFAKPNGQSRACASYAMARKRLLKTNHFVKPNAEPNEVRAMPRREMEERNPTISLSRVQSRTGVRAMPRRKMDE